ncbi:MAG: 50S ribosomal protein L30 [Bacillota bacterium]
MAKLKITLVKSLIGRPENQRATVKSLGLGKTNSFVVKNDSPIIMGMIKKVSHLVKVEEA